MDDNPYRKKRWSRIETYAGGLDVPLNLEGVNPRLIQPTIDFHRSAEALRNTLGSRERQLLKMKIMGIKSLRHE